MLARSPANWTFPAFLACACLIAPPAAPDPPRNVVLVVVDSLRRDTLSSYGYHRNTSPNIDAVAAEGIRFENAFTTAPSTPPSMAGIMSGRAPFFDLGIEFNTAASFGMTRFYKKPGEQGLPADLTSLAEHLSAAGYATAGFVTNPHVRKTFQFEQGFETYEEMFEGDPPLILYSRAGLVVDRAIAWLESRDQRPFFQYLHFDDVHYPYYPPEEYRARFDFARIPNSRDQEIQEPWLREDPALLAKPNAAGHLKGLYDCALAYTDAMLQRYFDYLRASGLWNDTLIVFTADHGEEFLEHGGTTHKGKLYDELMRVPLIVRGPGISPGVRAAAVSNFDAMPTILEFCGIDTNGLNLDARSLWPALLDPGITLRAETFAAMPSAPHRERSAKVMIRTSDAKAIVDLENQAASEYFDLKTDPFEESNRAVESAVEIAALLDRSAPILARLRGEQNLAKAVALGAPAMPVAFEASNTELIARGGAPLTLSLEGADTARLTLVTASIEAQEDCVWRVYFGNGDRRAVQEGKAAAGRNPIQAAFQGTGSESAIHISIETSGPEIRLSDLDVVQYDVNDRLVTPLSVPQDQDLDDETKEELRSMGYLE